MATIWVTGARGFIGRHLAAWLSRRGHLVLGIGHGAWPASEAAGWGITHWLNSEIDAHSLQHVANTSGPPETVYHLAGGSSVGPSLVNPFEDFNRTVTTTARLLDWLRINSPETIVIAASSAAVYGSEYIGPIPASAAPAPCSPYGRHKLMMEELYRSYSNSFGILSMVVRLFSAYGPWLQKQLLWDLCCKLASGESCLRLDGTGEELRDWIEIRDIVRLLELARGLAGPQAPIINGGSGIGTSVRLIASMVVQAWPAKASLEFSGVRRPGDPFSLVADTIRLRSLDFQCGIPVDLGVRDYVSWFLKTHGGLP